MKYVKVEIMIKRSGGFGKDQVNGLGLVLSEFEESQGITQLEVLFQSCLINIYQDKYKLEIVEVE